MPKDFDAERYELEKGWNLWQRDLDREMAEQIKAAPGMFMRQWLPEALKDPVQNPLPANADRNKGNKS